MKWITDPEQQALLLNAQQLVNAWNNLVIEADTGVEQLERMRRSGLFAEDIDLRFDMGQQKLAFRGLVEPEAFYTNFIDGLKKGRINLASNVEALSFEPGRLRFRFKHWIFFGGRLSVVGDNECVLEVRGQECCLSSAYIKVILMDAEHAY